MLDVNCFEKNALLSVLVLNWNRHQMFGEKFSLSNGIFKVVRIDLCLNGFRHFEGLRVTVQKVLAHN